MLVSKHPSIMSKKDKNTIERALYYHSNDWGQYDSLMFLKVPQNTVFEFKMTVFYFNIISCNLFRCWQN